ncbi:hypothetical protein [Massilia sp. Bi118]|uniref:hypothetical protein n=1 Tax=Massilia sp. Bi118 TaxID=2822346 RepID=UPI001E5C8307|nr:hypothetical protein [Massilia sp. Bi118]
MQHPFNQGVARRLCSIAVLALMASPAWAGPAEAQASQSGAAQQPAKQEVQAAVPAKAGLSLDFGPAADLGKLEQSRGGAAETKNDMKLDGVVTGNSATNVVTGANSIDSGAFSNMSGIPVVIQNSGANVLIQSATIINVQFK